MSFHNDFHVTIYIIYIVFSLIFIYMLKNKTLYKDLIKYRNIVTHLLKNQSYQHFKGVTIFKNNIVTS